MIKNKIKNKNRVPLVTDVVVPGDPKLKLIQKDNEPMSAEQNLKRRIDDVERAIGQNEIKRLGRAHAIRSENIITE